MQGQNHPSSVCGDCCPCNSGKLRDSQSGGDVQGERQGCCSSMAASLFPKSTEASLFTWARDSSG